jgi:hypothetical protein
MFPISPAKVFLKWGIPTFRETSVGKGVPFSLHYWVFTMARNMAVKLYLLDWWEHDRLGRFGSGRFLYKFERKLETNAHFLISLI